MKRLTSKRNWEEAKSDLKHEMGYSHIWKRLAEIENILGDDGDDYDLGRLKELVEADRNHLRKEQKTQTNADKIRSMTDEELYDFLCSFASRYTDISSPCAFRAKLFYVMGWLKQPAEED